MTGSGQSNLEVSLAELREIRWRAFLAGFDARLTERPLMEYFELWCEREASGQLDALLELTR